MALTNMLKNSQHFYINKLSTSRLSLRHISPTSFQIKLYDTKHAYNRAHGGPEIIIHDTIKFAKDYLQVASITIEEEHGLITTITTYCQPKHLNKKEHFQGLFNTLRNKFIAMLTTQYGAPKMQRMSQSSKSTQVATNIYWSTN